MLNTPTAITLGRILLIPVFVFTAEKHFITGAAIFAIASATDILDGYIARRSKKITNIGVLLDPIADKLLVVSALIILVDMKLIPSWLAIVIITREFLITGLRIIAISKNIVIPAELGGKIKMGTQIAAILILLLNQSALFESLSLNLHSIGIVCLWISMIIGIISGIQYFISFYEKI